MKKSYGLLTSMLISVSVIFSLQAQNLSTYHGDLSSEESATVMLPVLYSVQSVEDQAPGYSHGIEYKSSSNSLNMMECVVTHETENAVVHEATLAKRKYLSMAKVLSLSNQEAEAFFTVYARYESEISKLVSAIPDPNTLLELTQIVKDKFFNEISTKSGSYLASRFLAWENYYSNTCASN